MANDKITEHHGEEGRMCESSNSKELYEVRKERDEWREEKG